MSINNMAGMLKTRKTVLALLALLLAVSLGLSGCVTNMDAPRQSKYSPTSPVPPDRFVMRIQTKYDGILIPDTPYKLEVGGETFEGTTVQGMIDHQVKPGAKKAKVSVYLYGKENPPQVYDVDIHAQASIDSPEGIQSRLKNLGFYNGPLDGDLSSGESQAAIRRFLDDRKKPATFSLEDTKALLRDYHDY
jgi:type VI secretion system secreted protein VgrG